MESQTEVRCKHGMNIEWCAWCTPDKEAPKRRPSRQRGSTSHGVGAAKSESLRYSGYALVNTRGGCRQELPFRHLGPHVQMVHLDGHPFLWAIKLILEKCPNLKTVQVIPTMLKMIKGHSHEKLCQERNVTVTAGHWRPDLVWSGQENRSPYYSRQKTFLLGLEGEQKELFGELVGFGFDEALMTARYFCLKGEEFIPQWQVSEEFGYRGEATEVSTRVSAIFRYLDPAFETGFDACRRAGQIKKRVERIRLALATQLQEDERLRQLGLESESLPTGLPLSRLLIYKTVLEASKSGKLEGLKSRRPAYHQVLITRYGVLDKKFKTLRETGENIGISHERVRQIEEEALGLLGISEED